MQVRLVSVGCLESEESLDSSVQWDQLATMDYQVIEVSLVTLGCLDLSDNRDHLVQ